MRPFLLLLLALALGSCDTSGTPTSDLVGTWVGDGAVVAALVTSRTRQVLPDLTQRALQPLTITGDEDRTLDYLSFRGSQDVRNVLLTDVPSGRRCGACTRFETFPRTDGTWQAVLDVDGRRYVGEFEAAAFRLTPTGYVLAPGTLRSDDTGAEVIVGGEMTFPTVVAEAGRESVAPIGTSQGRSDGRVSITFGDDGTFTIEEEGGSYTAARWTELADGSVSVNLRAVEGGSGPAYDILLRGTVARDGDRLAFFLSSQSDADAARRDPASFRIEEERLHAEAGSFTAFRPGRAFRLRAAASGL